MKQAGKVFFVFLLFAPIGLFFMGKHLDTGKEVYLYGFYATFLVYIMLAGAVLHLPALRSDAPAGTGTAISRFFSLYLGLFVLLTLGWFGVESFLFEPKGGDTDFFEIMRNSVLVAFILTLFVSAVFQMYRSK